MLPLRIISRAEHLTVQSFPCLMNIINLFLSQFVSYLCPKMTSIDIRLHLVMIAELVTMATFMNNTAFIN